MLINRALDFRFGEEGCVSWTYMVSWARTGHSARLYMWLAVSISNTQKYPCIPVLIPVQSRFWLDVNVTVDVENVNLLTNLVSRAPLYSVYILYVVPFRVFSKSRVQGEDK